MVSGKPTALHHELSIFLFLQTGVFVVVAIESILISKYNVLPYIIVSSNISGHLFESARNRVFTEQRYLAITWSGFFHNASSLYLQAPINPDRFREIAIT
jgi:hypothetical protein